MNFELDAVLAETSLTLSFCFWSLCHPMKTTAIFVAIIVVTAAILLFWMRSRRREIKSFWDVVRNPEAMPDLDELHREVDATAKSLSGSSTEIAQLVDFFVFETNSSGDAWTELQILAKLGNEAYPRALEILRDSSMKERLSVLTKHANSLPEAPINRLCEIFDQGAPPPEEAAVLLAPYLQSESDSIRKHVALIVGSVGSAVSLPDLRRALTDEDEYVRSYALMGIQRAIAGDRIKASSSGIFFALVSDLWPGDTSFNVSDSIPTVLLKLNRDRAIDYLLSDKLFSVRFHSVWRILEAFRKESVEVPRTRLLTIIDEARKEPLEYPMDNALQEALPLLGAHRNEEDLEMFGRLLDHSNEKVSRGATEALYQFHRYDELIRDPWKVVDNNGWHALTVAEKHILAIKELDAEVNNGGFAQYYFNSSGNHWQDAQDGLAAIGAERRQRLMLATIEKFGETKPAADRNTRTSQLSRIVRRKEDPFNEQDNEWYRIKNENLDRLVFKYNLASLEGREEKLDPMAQPPTWSTTFANDGGPLIVLPRDLLGYWQGSEGVSSRDNFPFGPDYTRACEAAHPVDLLKVGPGFGLVIGSRDHVCTANWVRLPEWHGAILVGWSYGDEGSEDKVVHFLRSDASAWRRLRSRIEISNRDLVLLHAACAGQTVRVLDSFGEGYAVIGDGVPFRIEPGSYVLEVKDVGGNFDSDPFGCVICRWVPF